MRRQHSKSLPLELHSSAGQHGSVLASSTTCLTNVFAELVVLRLELDERNLELGGRDFAGQQ